MHLPQPIASPCVLVCQLDLTAGLCTGCGRSREEIARWTRYTDAQREEVMAELPARLAELNKVDPSKKAAP